MIIAVVLSIKLVRDVPYTGPREIDALGAILSVVGMGGVVLSILVWQEGGESVGALMVIGLAGLIGFAPGCAGASVPGSRRSSIPACSAPRRSGWGSPNRCCNRSLSAA